METKLQSLEHLPEGLKEVPSENLKILRQQMINALNEAESTIHAINRELEIRGEE